MTTIITATLAIALYLIASILGWKDQAKPVLRYLLMAAVLLHLFFVYQNLWPATGLDLGFFSIFTLVGWLCAVLLWFTTLRQPLHSLGIIVYPFAALSVGLRLVFSTPHTLSLEPTVGLELHILLSVLAYSLLSIAVIQAILLFVQDARLRQHHPGGFTRSLPPLETMESLLFRMITLGFSVLSLSLLSGMIYLEDMFAQHLVHKTILSFIAWGLFAILLIGRWRFGWRGQIAIRWAITAFITLMLAYFGSKFVLELVLQR